MPELLTDGPHLLFAVDQGCEGQRETGKPWFRESRFVWRLCSCGSTPMRPRSGGSPRGRSCSSCRIRHVERAIPCSLARQHHGHRLQLFEGQLLGLAQIGTVEFPLAPAVGLPVLAPSSAASPLFARREGPVLTVKGEGRGGTEPGIPVRGVHQQVGRLTRLLVGECIALDEGRRGSHGSLPSMPCCTELGVP